MDEPDGGGDGDTDGDTDSDTDHDCVEDPQAEGCPCEPQEPVFCFTGAPGIPGEGPCQGGIRHCVDGLWGPCEGEILPQPERCNVRDDDCDGVVDNDIDCGGGPVETHPCPGAIVEEAFTHPELEFQWGEGEPPRYFPTYVQVIATPVVADIVEDLDEAIPEVAIVTYVEHQGVAVMRVLSGREPHAVLWSDAGYGDPDDEDDLPRLDYDSHPAAGDLDGDGRVELLAILQGGGMVAYRGNGRLLWESDELTAADIGQNASIAIADLEGDGDPEIVVGRVVLDNRGFFLWRGAGGAGNNTQGPLSCVADLDEDGVQEVVAGRTVYTADGEIFWDLGGIADGFCAIADVYDLTDPDAPTPGRDDAPEVIRVADGWVRIHAGLDGTELDSWHIPADIGFDTRGGAPTVADYDGDDLMEIGVAGASAYSVWDVDEHETLWSQPTEDDSSRVTSSTVFDFNGDGEAEVIYNDEQYFRVYAGPDGDVRFEEPNPSRTRTEQPIVADVDADGNAEIVFVANNEADFAGDRIPAEERIHGFEIWGSADDAWIPARRIWNQHTYHVDNVEENGRIPIGEPRSWESHNTYRAQQPSELVVLAPDLTAGVSPFDESRCPDVLRVCAAIQNTGEHFVGPGIRVAFYDGNPEAGAVAIGTTETMTTLDPGDQEVVCVDWLDPPEHAAEVWVSVDPENEARECDELNNVVFLGEGLCPGLK